MYFATKLQWMFQHEPQVYQQLVAALTPEQQQTIQNFMNAAQARVNAAVAAQQQNGGVATPK